MNLKNVDILDRVMTLPLKTGYSKSGEAVIDRRHQKVIDAVKGEGHILEVGPGNGKLALWFLMNHQPVSLVDVTDENLKEFYALAGDEYSVPMHLFTKPSDWDIIPDNSFKHSIACEVIEHVTWWKELLYQMIRVTRGKVVLTTPAGKSFWDPGHVNFFELGDFAHLDAKVEEIITKKADLDNGQRCFYVEIDCA